MNTTAGRPAAPALSFHQLLSSSTTAALNYIFDVPPDLLSVPTPVHDAAQPQEAARDQQQQASILASSTGQPPPVPAHLHASGPSSSAFAHPSQPGIHAASRDAFSQQLWRVSSILEGRQAGALTEAGRVSTGRLGPAHAAMDAGSGTKGLRVGEDGLLVSAAAPACPRCAVARCASARTLPASCTCSTLCMLGYHVPHVHAAAPYVHAAIDVHPHAGLPQSSHRQAACPLRHA
jgi:hypothetical protein